MENDSVIEPYGVRVELNPHDEGHVTDVIVIARAVFFDDSGNAWDSLVTSSSVSTTGLVRRAMIEAAADAVGSYYFMAAEGGNDDHE